MALRKMFLDNAYDSNTPSCPYFIKNKDKILCKFIWNESDVQLCEDYCLPQYILDEGLREWLESRTPPKHREHMQELMLSCGLTDTKSVIDFSKGLSLTDTLWVTSENKHLWEDVSLFRNEFDDTISRIAFDGGVHRFRFSTTSPEFGTNGMLAKCWVREGDGEIYLYKAGTAGASNTGMEPYSEVLADQILNRLGYNHVHYDLARYHGKLVSRCKLLTSEDTMMVPVYLLYPFRNLESLIDFCIRTATVDNLAQCLIFDYLTYNTDRHAGNFGFLLDADTFSIKGFAPIYDNGCSCLTYIGSRDPATYVKLLVPALYGNFELGARKSKQILKRRHNVERLINFEFDRRSVPGFPEERLKMLEEILQMRVQAFLAM